MSTRVGGDSRELEGYDGACHIEIEDIHNERALRGSKYIIRGYILKHMFDIERNFFCHLKSGNEMGCRL